MCRLALSLLFLSAASCGDDGGNTTPQQDAATTPTDAPDVDAAVPTGTVKITVTDLGGAAVAGARVHFQNADSSVVLSTNTDANGVATATMADGGFVTVVRQNVPDGAGGTQYEVQTFAGVKGGDELVIAPEGGGAVTNVTVTGPRDSDNTVTNYRFATPCTTSSIVSPASGNPQTTLGLYGPCLPATDHLITSLNTNQQVVKYLFAANQTPTGNALDLGASTLVAPTTRSYTFSNVPVPQQLSVSERLYSGRGQLFQQSPSLTGTTTVTGTLPVPAFTGAVALTEATSSTPVSLLGVGDWGPFSPTLSVDYGARQLKRLTTMPGLDVANHRLTYNETTTGQTADFVLGSLAHVRQATQTVVFWSFTAPYAAGGVRIPTLPVENSVDLNMPGSDLQVVQLLVLAKVTGGYDAIRETALGVNNPNDLVTGASGQFAYVVSSSNNTRTVGSAQGKLGVAQPVGSGWIRR